LKVNYGLPWNRENLNATVYGWIRIIIDTAACYGSRERPKAETWLRSVTRDRIARGSHEARGKSDCSTWWRDRLALANISSIAPILSKLTETYLTLFMKHTSYKYRIYQPQYKHLKYLYKNILKFYTNLKILKSDSN
jgi:hypothetical protein